MNNGYPKTQIEKVENGYMMTVTNYDEKDVRGHNVIEQMQPIFDKVISMFFQPPPQDVSEAWKENMSDDKHKTDFDIEDILKDKLLPIKQIFVFKSYGALLKFLDKDHAGRNPVKARS